MHFVTVSVYKISIAYKTFIAITPLVIFRYPLQIFERGDHVYSFQAKIDNYLPVEQGQRWGVF